MALSPGAHRVLLGGLTSTRPAGPIVNVQTEWLCYDGVDLSDGSLYGTYRSHSLVNDCPRVGQSAFSERVAVPSSMVDNGLSPPKGVRHSVHS